MIASRSRSGMIRHYISRDDKLVVAPGSTIVRGNAGRGKVQGLCRFARLST
jgi:hypothetical protein